jgi:hypothetical protein
MGLLDLEYRRRTCSYQQSNREIYMLQWSSGRYAQSSRGAMAPRLRE